MLEGIAAQNGLAVGNLFGGSNKKQRSQGFFENIKHISQRDRAQSSNNQQSLIKGMAAGTLEDASMAEPSVAAQALCKSSDAIMDSVQRASSYDASEDE